MVVTAAPSASLAAELRRLLPDLWALVGPDRRCTVVFVTGDGAGNTYVFDLKDRVKTSVASTTSWTWARDGDGNLVKQTGSATYTYDWNLAAADPQLASFTASSTNTYRYDPTGRVGTATNGTVHESYAHDWLGGPTDMVSAAGAVVRSYDFTPIGNSHVAIGAPTATGIVSDVLFQGLPTTHLQGLYYTPSRTYDTASGRFTGADPAFMSSGTAWDSPYVFARNNPSQFTDPTGRFSWGAFGWFLTSAVVNFGRGASGGLSDAAADAFSPGASDTVEGSGAIAHLSQATGFVASIAVAGGGRARRAPHRKGRRPRRHRGGYRGCRRRRSLPERPVADGIGLRGQGDPERAEGPRRGRRV